MIIVSSSTHAINHAIKIVSFLEKLFEVKLPDLGNHISPAPEVQLV